MGFLKRLAGGESAPEIDPTLVIDDCLGNPEAHASADRIAAGDDLAVRAALTTSTDPVHRDFLIDAVLKTGDPAAPWVARWVTDEPDSALANMILGRQLVFWAWDARTHERAERVSQEQFAVFFERLEQSRQASERALELDPTEGSTYAFMIDCARGLQADDATKLALYDSAQASRPWHPIAHISMIQALAVKWGGSEGVMLDFARRVSRQAPEGSDAHVVIADAHAEGLLEHKAAYRTSDIHQELVEAAARSIDSPRYQPSPWTPRVRSAFAWCFAMFNDRDRARRQLELVGPLVAGPFLFSRDPLRVATGIRRDVGLDRGR